MTACLFAHRKSLIFSLIEIIREELIVYFRLSIQLDMMTPECCDWQPVNSFHNVKKPISVGHGMPRYRLDRVI